MSKRCSEVPNYMREMLGLSTRKHSGGRYSGDDGTHEVPEPLHYALEHLLLERIALGEEVISDFAEDIMKRLVETCNDCVDSLRDGT